MIVKLTHDDPRLGSIAVDLKQRRLSALELNLYNVRFADSFLLTRWRCLIDLALENKIPCSIAPPHQKNVEDYVGRMGLFDGTTYKYPYQKRSPEKFFPLRKIESDRNDWIFEDAERVLSHAGVGKNYVYRLCEVFVELADNIYFHAGAKLNTGWGYAHAQVLKRKVTISLCDVGIGFYQSYVRTGQVRNRSEKKILLDSFEELESSLNPGRGKGHRGLGLSEARDFVLNVGGLIELYSGKNAVRVRKRGGIQIMDSDYNRVEGAWIKMVVPIL